MPYRNRRSWAIATAVALTATVALASPAYAAPNNNSVAKITKAVTLEGVMRHLQALQGIATANGDRAAGRPGHRASVDYVVAQLQAAGYSPEVQEFSFDYFDENNALVRVSPNPTTYADERDFTRNTFDSGSPEGTATGQLVPVGIVVPAASLPPNSNTSGCEAADFAGFPAGGIALVQRGSCGFAVKVLNAQAAGAAGVIVMNEGQPGRTGLVGMIGDATGLTIPAVFATSATGEDLASTPGATVTVTVSYDADVRTAYNVTAETAAGNDANTVMAGAHLDSVQDGAGINDNGTGSAALLETAIQMSKVKPNNTVRFAWWGAEESGLLGSEHYVSTLTDEQKGDIALYLNFDMIGSPNYFQGVYDGDNSSGTDPDGIIPEGSAQIEDVFEAFYTSRGEPFEDTEFSGRSDYGPFIEVGIPAGGLFTGAEGVKTAEQAAVYGGTAGVAFDSCYHQPCDTITNLNAHALDINSDAVAASVMTFAFDTSTVNGVRTPGKSHGAGKSADAMRDRFAD